MILVVLSGIIIAILQPLIGPKLKKWPMVYTLLPATLFLYFLAHIPAVSNAHAIFFNYSWLPSAGIHLAFKLDGLSLIFSLMITGIGALVFLYASAYMKGDKYVDRFYGFLSLFMAAMLGVVLSDNVMALFCFWELTSISSFYLIGFKNEDQASRKSALTALVITGGGGLLLFAGLLLAGSLSGTYSIHEMMMSKEVFRDHPLYILLVILILLGAFTKSAQFPFHFWLPGAMKAPTPVSAYLHSATMVKAGVYLAARFTPVLGGEPAWNQTLIVTGGFTMLYAAFHSIFRTDLKAILAFSTVAALGLLFFLLGIGTEASFIAASVFLLVHALYKAGLFLTAGAIDHETGTRDVTALSGLRKVLLPLGIAGLLAALSNAGIPLTFGFLGKDLIYEATLHAEMAIALTAAAVATNILLLYAGFQAGVRPFTGTLPDKWTNLHLPHWAMWAPPLLLGTGGLIFGLFPALIDQTLIQSNVYALTGRAVHVELKLWHGLNLILLLSGITLAIGFALFAFFKPSAGMLNQLESTVSPQRIGEVLSGGFQKFSLYFTSSLTNGYLRFYIFTIISFLVGLLCYKFFTRLEIHIDQYQLGDVTLYEAVVIGTMIIATYFTITTSSRLTAVAALGVVGLCLCLIFVFYSAPDLAMTQFTIDTLTVVLFVLVLFKLPPFLQFTHTKARIRDAILAIACGFLITVIALEVLAQPVDKNISAYYAENAYKYAKGKNVVNVILVDFRGMDTLIEITVLTIAAIGVYSLLGLKVNPLEKE